jgi:hypothetical protein
MNHGILHMRFLEELRTYDVAAFVDGGVMNVLPTAQEASPRDALLQDIRRSRRLRMVNRSIERHATESARRGANRASRRRSADEAGVSDSEPTRGNILEEIRAGAALRRTERAFVDTGRGVGSGSLLEAIRARFTETTRSSSATGSFFPPFYAGNSRP